MGIGQNYKKRLRSMDCTVMVATIDCEILVRK